MRISRKMQAFAPRKTDDQEQCEGITDGKEGNATTQAQITKLEDIHTKLTVQSKVHV